MAGDGMQRSGDTDTNLLIGMMREMKDDLRGDLDGLRRDIRGLVDANTTRAAQSGAFEARLSIVESRHKWWGLVASTALGGLVLSWLSKIWR